MSFRSFLKSANQTTRAYSTRPVPALCGLALLWVLSACARDDDGLHAFRAALASRPGVAPRLSLIDEFRPCTERLTPAGTIPVADCPAPHRWLRRGPPRLPVSNASTDPRSQRLLALVDLVAQDPRGIALDRSISSLRRLAELSGDSAPVLADLAAALIVRAERTQAPRDLLEAYEMAEQAVAREPRNAAALYNRALAIDRIGLVDEGVAAWQAYLAADSTSDWAGEARRRVTELRATHAPPPPQPDAPLAAFRAYAAADPQKARELGMNEFLRRWGEAVAAGEPGRAETLLARVDVMGAALARHPGGDRTLADAVRTIRLAAQDPAETASLARGHRAFGVAVSLYDSAALERAEPSLDTAALSAGGSPALRGWAAVYLASVRVQLGRRDLAIVRLTGTVDSIDATAYPAMAGRAHWSLGTTLSRAERWDRGLLEIGRAAGLFERAGERENQAATLNTAVEARFVVGEPDSAYAALHRALWLARPYRASLRLHNLLGSASDQSAQDGLPRAAVLFSDEDVRVTGRLPSKFLPEALLRRTQRLAALGNLRRARDDAARAEPIVAGLDRSWAAGWYRANMQEAEAVTRFTADPGRRTAAFDSAAAWFTAISLPFRLLPSLVGAADARLAAGDPDDAARRLDRVMRLLEQRRDSLGMEPRRAAVFDAARQVVDRLAMLKLSQGRVAEALADIDRARASLAAAGTARSALTPRARPGETAVEYALVRDTLLVWTLAAGPPRVVQTVIDTLRLVRMLESLEAALERGEEEAVVRPALAQLYEWLIRPVAERLSPPDGPLVMVVDGDLAAVPFAALYDVRRGRYLVEDHPLRFAVSLAEAARPPPAESAREAVFVADPAFDRRENPLLDRLDSARAEVERIAGEYPERRVIEGPGATRAAVMDALKGAGVVHFAGHAAFDDARPERSYLVLAPSPGDPVGRLTAAELARVDLHRTRLVVLSACRTTRTRRSRAAGYTGLSGALLAAGAAGTVGSTWNVDDGSTSALMSAFHHAYRTKMDAAAALRSAQLSLLRSNNRRLRSPAAWGAFRYAGR